MPSAPRASAGGAAMGDAVPAYTPEVAEATAPLYERLRRVIPEAEWPIHAPYIHEINRLKRELNAVILAHNYQMPEIFHGIADITGDSLALARAATETDADVIVLCGVHFMAETAKLLNPEKTVLIPDLEAGCSLADAITADDVRSLRERYPGVPVVTYVNTSAAVKAESDICCTSGNAVEVVRALGAERIIFLPDEYLGRHVAKETGVEVILWQGRCIVHERFTGSEVRAFREAYPGVRVLAHPECAPDVLAEADYVGSTAGMIRHLGETRPARVMMVTECSMSDNVAAEYPDIEFVRPCNLCPHMKRIMLPGVLRSMRTMTHRIEIPEDVAARARVAVERMLEVGRGKGVPGSNGSRAPGRGNAPGANGPAAAASASRAAMAAD
jgi:quinolinate synthase